MRFGWTKSRKERGRRARGAMTLEIFSEFLRYFQEGSPIRKCQESAEKFSETIRFSARPLDPSAKVIHST